MIDQTNISAVFVFPLWGLAVALIRASHTKVKVRVVAAGSNDSE
jgi:hypothetical protein